MKPTECKYEPFPLDVRIETGSYRLCGEGDGERCTLSVSKFMLPLTQFSKDYLPSDIVAGTINLAGNEGMM